MKIYQQTLVVRFVFVRKGHLRFCRFGPIFIFHSNTYPLHRPFLVVAHMDISQEPFYAEIRKEHAMLQRPEKSNTGLNSYCKTPSVWTHWGKILDTTWMHGMAWSLLMNSATEKNADRFLERWHFWRSYDIISLIYHNHFFHLWRSNDMMYIP